MRHSCGNRTLCQRNAGIHEAWAGGVGSIGWQFTLEPGASTNIPLVIAWYFPERKDVPGVRNYYSTQWPDAAAVAEYLLANRQRLESQTRLFQETFFASTLPGVILESVSSQLAILRSPTVFREANGTMHGWEGCWPNSGSCEGTVDQVWHYVQSIAYLFPALERGMREFDYSKRIKPDGGMATRVWPTRVADGDTAFDGHFGTILRTCREWQVSGDTAWLRKLWPGSQESDRVSVASIGTSTATACSTPTPVGAARSTSICAAMRVSATACTWLPCSPARRWRGRWAIRRWRTNAAACSRAGRQEDRRVVLEWRVLPPGL